MAARRRFRLYCLLYLLCLAFVPGQVYPEGRALVRFAVNVDETVVLLDDAVNRGQSQAGAFARLLGGEKRLEKFIQSFPVHAAAFVAYSQQNIVSGDESCMVGAIGFIEGGAPRFDGDLSHARNGVPGVDSQVRQSLVNMGGIHLDRTQILARQPCQIDIFTDQQPQHGERALSTVPFRSSTLGATVCLRAMASSCRDEYR
jgi:hypothetical protein